MIVKVSICSVKPDDQYRVPRILSVDLQGDHFSKHSVLAGIHSVPVLGEHIF